MLNSVPKRACNTYAKFSNKSFFISTVSFSGFFHYKQYDDRRDIFTLNIKDLYLKTIQKKIYT